MHVANIYRRAFWFLAAMPLLAAIPFCTELLQHAVEARIGMYQSGTLTPQGRHLRNLFGVIKLAGIVVVIIASIRFWAFDGDRRNALRPGWRTGAGILIFIGIEIVESALEHLLRAGIAHAVDLPAAPVGVRYMAYFAPTIAWAFLSGLWLPWLVGMLADDRAMTLRRSVSAARGRLWRFFGLICAGVVPLMALHYLLGFAAVGQPEGIVWGFSILDAAIVVLLCLCIGSSFFGLYAIARDDARG